MTTNDIFPMNDPAYAAAYAEESAMVDASELIAEAMAARKMTASDLARVLDVGRSEISARLSGDRNITVRKLAATLHVLGQQLVVSTRPAGAAAAAGTVGRSYQVLTSLSSGNHVALTDAAWTSLGTQAI